MNFLTDWRLLAMPGPQFLVFFAVTSSIVIILALFLVRLADSTNALGLPRIAGVGNPYEVAWLSGGARQTAQTAFYELNHAGLIAVGATGVVSIKSGIGPSLSAPAARLLRDLQQDANVADSLASPRILKGMTEATAPLRQNLERRGLTHSREYQAGALKTFVIAGATLTALAGAKMFVALSTGHPNVLGLIVEIAIALVALAIFAGAENRRIATRRGRAVLKSMRAAYSRGTTASTKPDPNSTLLLLGLFGAGALVGTADAALAQHFGQSRSNGDSGGGGRSCSSGDGGNGRSCSSGGGGGGCGGCGGGGD